MHPAAALSRRHSQAPRPGFWAGLLDRIFLARQRRRLASLDDHILRDIGLTREEAQAEAAQPVWDVPAHWRR